MLLEKTQDEVSRLQQELELQKAALASQQEEWKRTLELAATDSTQAASVAVAEVTKSLNLQLEQQAQSHRQELEAQSKAKDEAIQKAELKATALLTAQQTETAALQTQVVSLEADLASCRDEVRAKEEQVLQGEKAHQTALQQQEVVWRETAETQASTQVCVRGKQLYRYPKLLTIHCGVCSMIGRWLQRSRRQKKLQA